MQVNILAHPSALPGQCWSCGGATKKFYIDIDLQIEFYGAFYLCNECFNQIATKVGYEPPQTVITATALIHELGQENQELRELINNLLTAIEHLNLAGARVDISDSFLKRARDSDFGSKQSDVVTNFPLDKSKSQGTAVQLEFGEGETSESGDDEGVAILRPTKPKPSNEFRLSFDK